MSSRPEPSFDDLADLGAELLTDPVDPAWLDLRGQITADQYHRLEDVPVADGWL